MRTWRLLIVAGSLTLGIWGCQQPDWKEYDAVIVKEERRHWGKGYFRPTYHFRYFDGADTLVGTSEERLVTSWGSRYWVGDSVKVVIEMNGLEDSRIISMIKRGTDKR